MLTKGHDLDSKPTIMPCWVTLIVIWVPENQNDSKSSQKALEQGQPYNKWLNFSGYDLQKVDRSCWL